MIKRYAFILGLSITIAASVYAMRVAPAPVETQAQKGTRLKKECLEHAKVALAKKDEHANSIRVNQEDLDELEIIKLAMQFVLTDIKDRVKLTVREIFPESPLAKKRVALDAWAEDQATKFLNQAQEEQLKGSSAWWKCGCFGN